jgi:hypothetical protein
MTNYCLIFFNSFNKSYIIQLIQNKSETDQLQASILIDPL